MSNERKSFSSLIKSIYSEEEWAEIALKLLLGHLSLKIVTIMKSHNYKRQKRVNPLMYWKIGNSIRLFLERREKDSKRYGRKVARAQKYAGVIKPLTSLLGTIKMKDLDVGEVERKDNEKLIHVTRFDLKKRTLEAALYFNEIIGKSDEINVQVPWSIYQEIAAKRGRLLELRKVSRNRIIENIVETRIRQGSKVNDRVIRKSLDKYLKINPDGKYPNRITRYIIEETS